MTGLARRKNVPPEFIRDMDKIALVLAMSDNLLFWGGKTLRTLDGKRLVFNEFGELCRIQEMCDGAWLTIARADESVAED